MVVGVSFCKIKVDSDFLLVLKIKGTKFHQDRSKTVDLHTKYTKQTDISSLVLPILSDRRNSHYFICKIVDYIIKSRSESFCAKHRD
jgi:hypothetical protein